MSRKDTIIVAVLVNAGLLIVLFASALKMDKETVVVQAPPPPPPVVALEVKAPVLPPAPLLGDEIDHVLQRNVPSSNPFLEDLKAFSLPEVPVVPIVIQKEESSDFVEVKVKKGDVLEKLARHHQTSVAEIMKVNALSTTNLRIGQVLKMPKGSIKKEEVVPVREVTAQYYTVKKGDSPWTIAVKNHMKVEDLLKLNNLSESQARHLKPGDQLRIQ